MKPNLTIDEMAIKQLLSHKNDKSFKWLAKMNGRFGRTAADEAMRRNVELLRACGVTYFNTPDPWFAVDHTDWIGTFDHQISKKWSQAVIHSSPPPAGMKPLRRIPHTPKTWFDELT